MNKYIFLLAVLLSPLSVFAHDGSEPIQEISKNKKIISKIQIEFDSLSSKSDKRRSILRQINFLRKRILTLRNLMASEYPHLSEEMSKYKLDYMAELDRSLEFLRITLNQLEETVE